MVVRTSKSAFRALLLCCVFACTALVTKGARAEESIIKRPGDHPAYSVEIEPHLLAAFLLTHAGAGDGYGLGGRFSIPLMKNGFISSINNNVAIGFGLDWARYSGCYYNYYAGYVGYAYNCPTFNTFIVPVVMQWNFFLSTHWSVFGEPGLALEYASYGDCPGVIYDAQGRPHGCGAAPSRLTVDPFVLFIGGRFHFSESASLTMRVGWPYFSIGVSFMP